MIEIERERRPRAANDVRTPTQEAVALVLAGVIVQLAHDPRLRAMYEVNDVDRFLEGCRAPWFNALLGQALLNVRAAATTGRESTGQGQGR